MPTLRRWLGGPGLDLVTGNVQTRIVSRLASVARGIATLYPEFPAARAEGFADFHVEVGRPLGARRWYRPQVLFWFDGRSIFKPLAVHQAYPMLEWGLNWCVTTQVNHCLLFHAAVVARDDRALLLPGPPGSGKSTLCAALVTRGWRLLSDELAMVDLETGMIRGLARPVSLKNASIPVIRAFAQDVFVSDPCHDTLKGTVAHMRPPVSSVQRMNVPARPAWIVFPRFQDDGKAEFVAVDQGEGFLRLVRNAFNYSPLGRAGFDTAAELVAQSDFHDLTYSNLSEAVAFLDDLAGVPARSAD